jgi:tetratricopeptide (TPR) repeat protein
MLGRLLETTSAWAAAEERYRAVLDLAKGPDGAQLRAQAQTGIGTAFWGRGQYEQAGVWLELGRHAFTALDDRAGLSETLLRMGRSFWMQGKAEITQSLMEELLSLEGEDGDKGRIAIAYHLLGNVAQSQQNLVGAREWWQKSLDLKRELGDKLGVATASGSLAMAAFAAGQFDKAWALATESFLLFQQMGARWQYCLAQLIRGLVLAAQGDAVAARAMHTQTLATIHDIGTTWIVDIGLLALAEAVQLSEQTAEASQYALKLIAAAENLHATSKSSRQPIFQPIIDGILARAKQHLDPVAFDHAWAEGYALDWREAIDVALARA